jgi:adenosylmethionine---8-amino-7-oxononanoate aminotransferase
MKTGDDNLSDFDQQHIWHPFTSLGDKRKPILIKDARGSKLYTADGNTIIDAISSWWVNLHGHSNAEIADAIAKQASKLEHVIFAGFTHEPAITVAQNLLTVLPKNLRKVFFSDDGSTAVEVAIKLALQYWHNKGKRKTKLVALEGAYHGDTFGAMSVGARSPFTAAFNSLLFEVNFLRFPTDDNLPEVIADLRQHCKSDEVAAFIYEPLVQGAAGMRMYESKLLDALMEIAKQHNVLCIADEVFTGFGRTGKWFASEYGKHEPDIIAVSKGITGGALPLGVTACSQEVVEAFISEQTVHTFFHGHSYTANPLACAAAIASFNIMRRAETWDRIRLIQQSHELFVARIKGHVKLRDVRTMGTILAIELDTGSSTSYFNEIKTRSYAYFLERGILLRPLGNVVYIVPPYILSQQELDYIYGTIEEFLKTL